MRKKKFILFLLITFATPAFSSNKLTVLTEDWPPFNYMENNKIIGISTDLVETTLKQAGIEYDLSIMPWKRAYQTALNNPNTLLYTTSRTKKRENLFKWVGPLYPRQIILYGLKSRTDIEANNLDDIKKFKIGILRGGSVEEYLQSKGFEESKHYEAVGKEEQNIGKLFLKRVDLIPGSEMSMAFRMKFTPYKFSDLKPVFVLIDQGGFYMAINKGTPDEVVRKIQYAFNTVINQGLRQEITKKYLGY